jgi:hypothetical protein
MFGKMKRRAELLRRLDEATTRPGRLRDLAADELLFATYLFDRFKHHAAAGMAAQEVERRMANPADAAELQRASAGQQGLKASDFKMLESEPAARLLDKLAPTA